MGRVEPVVITPKREFYRNLETGLVRCFPWSPPKRGKWELTTLRHESPAIGRARFAALHSQDEEER